MRLGVWSQVATSTKANWLVGGLFPGWDIPETDWTELRLAPYGEPKGTKLIESLRASHARDKSPGMMYIKGVVVGLSPL